MLDLLLTPLLIAMSISPELSSMNSSRATPSDLDARKVSASGKSCFLELNRHGAAFLVL